MKIERGEEVCNKYGGVKCECSVVTTTRRRKSEGMGLMQRQRRKVLKKWAALMNFYFGFLDGFVCPIVL